MSMSEADAIDLVDAGPDTQDDRNASTKVSLMYATWHFEKAPEMRDKSHNGAQCLPCKQNAITKGIPLNPKGSCLADTVTILAHVKSCQFHSHSDRQRAEVELSTLRSKKRKRVSTASGSDTDISSGSATDSSHKKPALSRFMALEDKPLTTAGLRSFEQQCLKATVSANMPLSAWDDQELRKAFTDLRPAAKVPTRRTMSGRILDTGAQKAAEERLATVQDSDGMLCFAVHMFVTIQLFHPSCAA